MAQNLEKMDRPAIVDLAISLDVAKPGTRLRTPRLIELIREAEAATEKKSAGKAVKGKAGNVLSVEFTPATEPVKEVPTSTAEAVRKAVGRKATKKTPAPAVQDAPHGMCVCHDTRPAVYGVKGRSWMRLCAERGAELMTGEVVKHGEAWEVVKL